jgi:gliding motility-associated lipoprotein GldB
MKYFFYLLVLSTLIFSCQKQTKVQKAVEEIPLEFKVERFDKLFFETQPQDLAKLKQQYPYFFPAGNDDKVWLSKMQHPQWRELHGEVQKKFGNFESETNQLEDLFKHIKYYFPETKTPKVITLISEMDYQNKVIYNDSLVLISLELYLGKQHRFYEFPAYIKQNFETNQMMSDVVQSFGTSKIAPPTENTFLSFMIYAGKELYLKDALLPSVIDEDKIGYLPEQLQFCTDNETYMWRIFIEEKFLFSSDQKLVPRFINPAPFSKFYLEIDNKTPGRVGAWLGWQIVRSYMKNNEVSLQQLLKKDAKEIFEKSGYKPKK